MIIITFLFLLLTLILLIHFKSKLSFKSLRVFGIVVSLPILLFYFFIKNIDLASTPILLRTTNKTNEKLEVFYIWLYDSYSPAVQCRSNLQPNETSEEQLEAEAVKELWIIAVNKNDQVRYFAKKKNAWASSVLEFIIENNKTNFEVPEKNTALTIIKKFRINRFLENGLLIGSIILLAILIFKRKKTINQ